MNQCIRLVESLTELSKIRPVYEVKQAMHGIVSVLGNIRMVNFWYFFERLKSFAFVDSDHGTF